MAYRFQSNQVRSFIGAPFFLNLVSKTADLITLWHLCFVVYYTCQSNTIGCKYCCASLPSYLLRFFVLASLVSCVHNIAYLVVGVTMKISPRLQVCNFSVYWLWALGPWLWHWLIVDPSLSSLRLNCFHFSTDPHLSVKITVGRINCSFTDNSQTLASVGSVIIRSVCFLQYFGYLWYCSIATTFALCPPCRSVHAVRFLLFSWDCGLACQQVNLLQVMGWLAACPQYSCCLPLISFHCPGRNATLTSGWLPKRLFFYASLCCGCPFSPSLRNPSLILSARLIRTLKLTYTN